MKKKFEDIEIELLTGDIAAQKDIDAVMNAANADLVMGGGVAGALHSAAGPELENECRKYAPIKPGEAVITKAYNLPNKYVVHCLGPVYGRDKPEDKLLADCYENALLLADKKEIASIGFCALSTGAFGYPMEPAARVAFSTIKNIIPHLKYIKKIRFILHIQTHLNIHEKILNEIFG